MKLNGIFGTGSGKVGSSVFAVNSGVQIVRPYQSQVANPNTEGQVNQRGKFKLMSQLAAAMGTVIAIPKAGIVSPRNQFIKHNFPLATMNGSNAEVQTANLQITKSALGMIPITATRQGGTAIECKLSESAPDRFESVVYAIFSIDADGALSLVEERVVSQPGGDFDYVMAGAIPANACVVYAYGVLAASEEGKAKYANYNVASATQLATLVTSRQLTSADVRLTKTVSAAVAAQA